MFRIRREQREHFDAKARADFESRMFGYLRKDWADQWHPASDDLLAQWVHETTQLAFDHGIELEEHVAQFLLLMMYVIGDKKVSHEDAVEQILEDPDLDSEGKLRALLRALRDRGSYDLEPYVAYDELRPLPESDADDVEPGELVDSASPEVS